MRIGIDTLSIFPGKIGGGETYLVNLLKNIREIDKTNTYYLFVNHENHHLFPSSENFRKIYCNYCKGSKKSKPLRLFWEQFILPWQARLNHIDILFFPANILPIFFLPCKSVLILYDLNGTHLGEYKNLPRKEKKVLKFLITRSIQKAVKIMTISQNSKRDIISYLGIPEDKIVVVYGALEDAFQNLEDCNKKELKTKFGVGSNFILSVGTTHHHKNFLRLLDAYVLLKEWRSSFGWKLILVGMPGLAHMEIVKKVKELNLEKDVIIKGRVSTEELKILYCAADLFVFPSLYEGFGLPILEAMACGIPVVSSNAASLPEVGGEAAIYFNPLDINDMVEKILMVLEDINLRIRLRKKGFERLRNFSWEKAAKETLAVFEGVYKS